MCLLAEVEKGADRQQVQACLRAHESEKDSILLVEKIVETSVLRRMRASHEGDI